VVNLVDEALAGAMNKCAASLSYGEDELQHAGLRACPSSVVKPPRIAEAPVSLECKEQGRRIKTLRNITRQNLPGTFRLDV